MSLTSAQRVFLKSKSATDIASMVGDGKISIEDLRAAASSEQALRAKMPQIESIVATFPKPEEVQAFAALQEAVNSRPDDLGTIHLVKTFLDRWRQEASAQPHVAAADEMYAKLTERQYFSDINRRVKAAIDAHNRTGELPPPQVRQLLVNFLGQYQQYSFAAADVETARGLLERIDGMLTQVTTTAWKALLDSEGRINDIQALQNFFASMPVPAEIYIEADDKVWDWVLRQPDICGAAIYYEQMFNRNGKHQGELYRVREQALEWNNCYSLFDIKKFLDKFPDTPFCAAAADKVEQLRQVELGRLADDPRKCQVAYFKQLLECGFFSQEELFEAAGLSEEMYKSNIVGYENIRDILPPEPTANTKYGTGLGQPGLTDVIFLGITASGKTCVLSGLLRCSRLSFDEHSYSGDYAKVVESFSNYGMTLRGTPGNFVATIKASVESLTSKKVYDFNLFEMAGEAFANGIANARTENDVPIISFDDMGANAAKIFQTANDKIIFMLIDPTGNLRQQDEQRKCMRAVVNLFNSNPGVMERVQGLHFIVTKSDTLPEGDPRQQALETVRGILREAVIVSLINCCRTHGINKAKGDLDGRPRVFPFSLGHFTVGNMFEYDETGSSNILQVICDYCAPRLKKSWWNSVQAVFSKPLI